MSDIKKNVIYSSILTSANYVFPLITYPYVSRVLGVTNIGICNFIDSIINYYIMFSLLGIVAVAIREIAANKNDTEKLSHTFSGLFVLNSISTAIVLTILVISIYAVPKLYEYKELMFVGFFKVLFNYLLIDWFYKGIEDFKYITKYGLITKVLYVIGIFVFVTDKSDYYEYYLLSMLMIAANAIINMWHSRKFVHFSFKGISLRPYLTPFFVLGLYLFLTSMYTTFNVAYLGFVCDETEVGYYTTATKLHSIFLALFTAFTGVMLPRMSSLISEKNFDEFKILLSKSLHVLFIFAMPVIIFSVIFAPQIIRIISGAGYEPAATPMRIVMPLIFIIGYEQIVVIQVLMPMKKDKIIFKNSCIGAIFGFAANILLVGTFKSVGSSFVWTSSEVVVFALSTYYLKKYINVGFPFHEFFKYLLFSVPCLIALIIINRYVHNDFYGLLLGGFFVSAYYFILYVKILKDNIVTSLFVKIRKGLRF